MNYEYRFLAVDPDERLLREAEAKVNALASEGWRLARAVPSSSSLVVLVLERSVEPEAAA